MNEILIKLNAVKNRILSEKNEGLLRIFALIRRYDIDGKWDLILSADWMSKTNNENDLVYIINLLKEVFNENLDFVIDIITLAPEEIFIQQLAYSVLELGLEEEKNIFELKINHENTLSEIHLIYFDFDEEDLIPELGNIQTVEEFSINAAPNF